MKGGTNHVRRIVFGDVVCRCCCDDDLTLHMVKRTESIMDSFLFVFAKNTLYIMEGVICNDLIYYLTGHDYCNCCDRSGMRYC